MLIFFIVISILLTINIWLKISTKKSKKRIQESHKSFVEDVKNAWILKTVSTSNCSVIKYDKEIEMNPTNKDKFSFWERLNNNAYNKPKKILKSSKLICRVPNSNGKEKEVVRFIDMDYTRLDFKIKMRDEIDIYFADETLEDYYIDLDFIYK